METVIERLRVSKARYEAKELDAGKKAGRNWANSKAEYSELKAVASFDVDEHDGDLDSSSFQQLLDPEGETNQQEWQEFWESYYGRGEPSDAFIRGFIEGATEIYDEVADDL